MDRNIPKELRKNLRIEGEAPKGVDTIKQFAKVFDVVVIDSFQKLGVPSTRFDELRQEFPSTIWIVIFQQNGQGGTRGGVSADFDAPVAIKVHKQDNTFVNNWAELKKNRGNPLNKKYMISAKKTMPLE